MSSILHFIANAKNSPHAFCQDKTATKRRREIVTSCIYQGSIADSQIQERCDVTLDKIKMPYPLITISFSCRLLQENHALIITENKLLTKYAGLSVKSQGEFGSEFRVN